NLAEKYGDPDVAEALRARDGWPDHGPELTGGGADLDDFSACKITRKEDWLDLFVKPFYFGCEADDRMNATAFGKGNPFAAKLNAIYSSDIGHFDVIDMRNPLPEAYELGDEGGNNQEDFSGVVVREPCASGGPAHPSLHRGHDRGQGPAPGAREAGEAAGNGLARPI